MFRLLNQTAKVLSSSPWAQPWCWLGHMHVNPMVTSLSCHVWGSASLTLLERHSLKQKISFTQIAVKVVKFLGFDTFRVNIFLIAVASVVNTEKLCTSIHICAHMLDDRHLDGCASITIWDVFMFRLRKKNLFCSSTMQSRIPFFFFFFLFWET